MKRRALLFLVFHLVLSAEAKKCGDVDVKVRSDPNDQDDNGFVWAEGYEGTLYRAEIKAKKKTIYTAKWQQITSEETRSGVITFSRDTERKCTIVQSQVVIGCSSSAGDKFDITFGVENPLDAMYNNTKLKFTLSKDSSGTTHTCFEETIQVKKCEIAEPYSVISNDADVYNAEGIVTCADNSTYLSADDDGSGLSNIQAKCSSKAEWKWNDNEDLDDVSCLPKPQIELTGNVSIIENNDGVFSCSIKFINQVASASPQSNHDIPLNNLLSINYNNESILPGVFNRTMQLSDHGKQILCEVKIPDPEWILARSTPEWILARSTQYSINILYSPRRLENIPITCLWNVTKADECVVHFFSNPAADKVHLLKGNDEISTQKFEVTSVNSAAGWQKVVYKTTAATSKDSGIYQLQVVSSSFPQKILNINFKIVVSSSNTSIIKSMTSMETIVIIPLVILLIIESIVIAIISWKIHNKIIKRNCMIQKNREKSTCHRTGTLPTPSSITNKDSLYQECLDPYHTTTAGSITREPNEVYENEYEMAEID